MGYHICNFLCVCCLLRSFVLLHSDYQWEEQVSLFGHKVEDHSPCLKAIHRSINSTLWTLLCGFWLVYLKSSHPHLIRKPKNQSRMFWRGLIDHTSWLTFWLFFPYVRKTVLDQKKQWFSLFTMHVDKQNKDVSEEFRTIQD